MDFQYTEPGDRGMEKAAALLELCGKELSRRVVGQREMLDGLLSALVAGGHVLLEGVPGLAKTRAVKSLAELTALEFKRIQFTPDLLPADLTGTLIWEQAKGSFSVRKGPVFANLILADEINRSPAKVQSALLEAMEEKQVTIGEESYALPDPFLVLATQNPIEHEGTYALPEAELDRFFLKLRVRYPSPDEELRILKFADPDGAGEDSGPLRALLDRQALAFLRSAASGVHIDEQVKRYIVSVVSATRPPSARVSPEDAKKLGRQDVYRHISFGASPRASLALYRYVRVSALFQGRSFVTPADVKAAALPVLRHRVVLSYEAEADGLDADGVISRILASVPVP
ncbi:MAG: MoxR family ATPase [Spirochaetaceae bacterium]|nr:MoxR family ATPase [Spirochaetaceae bacterium]